MNALLTAAYVYARLGFHVFPIKPDAKTPLTQHGFHDATIDVDQIRKWWRGAPDANLGLRCGLASGIIVVDIDGPQGIEAIKGLDLLVVTAAVGIDFAGGERREWAKSRRPPSQPTGPERPTGK